MNNKYQISENLCINKYLIIKHVENAVNIVKKIILDLYESNPKNKFIHYFDAKKIMENLRSDSKDYTFLDKLKHKTGAYIFLYENKPLYIGVGGIKNKDDLKTRVKNECKIYGETKEKSATLSKNIQDIETALGNTDKVKHHEKLMKKFQIVAIALGDMSIKNNQQLAIILETILISLFHPKYNK